MKKYKTIVRNQKEVIKKKRRKKQKNEIWKKSKLEKSKPIKTPIINKLIKFQSKIGRKNKNRIGGIVICIKLQSKSDRVINECIMKKKD